MKSMHMTHTLCHNKNKNKTVSNGGASEEHIVLLILGLGVVLFGGLVYL